LLFAICFLLFDIKEINSEYRVKVTIGGRPKIEKLSKPFTNIFE